MQLEPTPPERPRPEQLKLPRVGDEERRRTAELLGVAVDAGYLDLKELDERLTQTWNATTILDLAEVEADLPPRLRLEREELQAKRREEEQRRAAFRTHLFWYLAVMTFLVLVWLTVALTAGAWYPWPIWPILAWGLGVAGHARAASTTPSH